MPRHEASSDFVKKLSIDALRARIEAPEFAQALGLAQPPSAEQISTVIELLLTPDAATPMPKRVIENIATQGINQTDIKARREALGLKQFEMASFLHVSQASLSLLENGNVVNPKLLARCHEALQKFEAEQKAAIQAGLIPQKTTLPITKQQSNGPADLPGQYTISDYLPAFNSNTPTGV